MSKAQKSNAQMLREMREARVAEEDTALDTTKIPAGLAGIADLRQVHTVQRAETPRSGMVDYRLLIRASDLSLDTWVLKALADLGGTPTIKSQGRDVVITTRLPAE